MILPPCLWLSLCWAGAAPTINAPTHDPTAWNAPNPGKWLTVDAPGTYVLNVPAGTHCVVWYAAGPATEWKPPVALYFGPLDRNGDKKLNSQDYFDFTHEFFAGTPTADYNHDGTVNSQDFFDFTTAFTTWAEKCQ